MVVSSHKYYIYIQPQVLHLYLGWEQVQQNVNFICKCGGQLWYPDNLKSMESYVENI
jgi:hypothetical protein